MKTLADLKRAIRPGAWLRLTHSNKPHSYLGVERAVGSVNTVGFSLISGLEQRRSYLEWPKASELSFPAPDTFTVTWAGLTLTYVITQQAPS